MEEEVASRKRRPDEDLYSGRSKRRITVKKITELELDVSYGVDSGKKWAQCIMAMTAPMSANSNTSDAVFVKTRVEALNMKYGGIKFIIGHLINEQFPRPVGDCNFVPLTMSGNAAHKSAIETKLARFLTGINGTQGSLYNHFLEDGLQFGILYKVEAANVFWETDIPKYVTWHVKLGVYNSHGVEQFGVHDMLLASLKTLAATAFNLPGIDDDAGLSGVFGNETVR